MRAAARVAVLFGVCGVAIAGPAADQDHVQDHLGQEALPVAVEPGLSCEAALRAAQERAAGRYGLQALESAAMGRRQLSENPFAAPPEAVLRYQRDELPGTAKAVEELETGVEATVWWPGQRGRLGRVADAEAALLEAERGGWAWALERRFLEHYWALREASLQAELSRAEAQRFASLEAEVTARVEAGDAAALEADQVRAQHAQRRLAELQDRSRLAESRFRWQQLTGHQGLPDQTCSDAYAAPAPQLVIARRERALADARATLADTESRGQPRLFLGGRQTTADDSRVAGVAIQLSLPLATPSQRASARAQAAVEQAQAEDRLMAAEYELALARHEAEHDLAYRQAALPLAEARFSAAVAELRRFEVSHRLGEASMAERLLAETRALEAERELHLARLALDRAQAFHRLFLGSSQ